MNANGSDAAFCHARSPCVTGSPFPLQHYALQCVAAARCVTVHRVAWHHRMPRNLAISASASFAHGHRCIPLSPSPPLHTSAPQPAVMPATASSDNDGAANARVPSATAAQLEMDEFGLLPVPDDCAMPDINWEDYDDPHDNAPPTKPTPSPTPPSAPQRSAAPKSPEPVPQDHALVMHDVEQAQRSRQAADVTADAPSRDVAMSYEASQDDANGRTGRYYNQQKPVWQKRKFKKPPKKPATPVFCELCGISVSCQKTMDIHIKGRAHRTKLSQKRLEAANKELDRSYEERDRRTLAELGITLNTNYDDKQAAAPSSPPLREATNNAAIEAPAAAATDAAATDAAAARPSHDAEPRATVLSARKNAAEAKRVDAASPRSTPSAAPPERAREAISAQRMDIDSAAHTPHAPNAPVAAGAGRDADRAEANTRAAEAREASRSDSGTRTGAAAPAVTALGGRVSSAIRSAGAEKSGKFEGNGGLRLRSGEPISPRLRSEATAQTGLRSERVVTGTHGERGGGGEIGAVLKPIAWDPFVKEFNASLVGKRGERVPQEFLDAHMSLSEWRELRRAVFEKGDEVDKLSFKIVAEMLLSPTVGVREDALTQLDRAIKRMRNEHYYSRETGSYTASTSIPEKLWKRERRFVEGDEEWMKQQSEEDKAMHLLCENVHYIFDQGEDYEVVAKKAHFSALPYRGGVTGFRSGVSKVDGEGGRGSGDENCVEKDELFQQIHRFLVEQRVKQGE
eukprot:TRINITY_DN914_c1_g2_i1.p2 TRINITY_DN914_c1_g2~~TRINITY_DN914_c1_g2_i1.p2  ORF type:complete len:741 (-),score=177.98 TRINITY_DN914_c1_g2_i1:729-2951(-)